VKQRSDSGAIDPLLRRKHAAPFGIPYRSPLLYGLCDSAGQSVVRPQPNSFASFSVFAQSRVVLEPTASPQVGLREAGQPGDRFRSILRETQPDLPSEY
jgi:hypothetical protein